MTATTTALRVAVDCPAYVWAEFGERDLGDFGAAYSDLLDEAGRELIRAALIAAWRARGWRPHLIDRAEFDAATGPPEPGDPDPVLYDEVRQEAADSITGDDLIDAADLRREYTAYLS